MYSRYRRESNNPRRTRHTRTGFSGSQHHAWLRDSFMGWFYRIYGNTDRRSTPAERDRAYTSNIAPLETSKPEPEDIIMAEEEELKSVPHVTGVDLHIADNTANHKTAAYDITEDREDDDDNAKKAELVLRRGEAFNLTITLSEEYNVDAHDITLAFSIGDHPIVTKNTLVKIPMNESRASRRKDPYSWGAQMTNQEGNQVMVSVYPAANCIIGEWDLSIMTIVDADSENGPRTYEYKLNEPIYILLNPWCKDDSCYMSTTNLLDEYVLNETGYQYYGNHRQIGAMPWLFGQFEEGILEVALTLLRLAFNGGVSTKMSDPVRIARALSKMVNSNDDQGVLVGNWSGDYDDGVNPSSWNGSVAILKQYKETGKAVSFGQCWVFSGVLTTVCRALGLPARSVTNFRSAHDTDGSVAIDKYYELAKDGTRRYLEDLMDDSIWNFHVWNDVWMSRPDLGRGFDGWQAIDATPQETSEGVYCCGPAPMSAIKNGKIDVNYDTTFLFSEVNGHVVHWQRSGSDGKEWEPADVDIRDVGRKISTKEPLASSREDVTHEYKYKDGSTKEVNVMLKVADSLGDGARDYLVPNYDVKIVMEDRDGIIIGSDFDVAAKLTNLTKEIRTVHVYQKAMVTTYTGVNKGYIKSVSQRGVTLEPEEEKIISMEVTFDEYYSKLFDGAHMRVATDGYVVENSQSVFAEDDFMLRKPTLDIETDGSLKKKEKLTITLSFRNPLSIDLTDGVIRLDCRNMAGGPKMICCCQNVIGPGETMKETVEVVPKRAGKKDIIATFECPQLIDVTGNTEVVIS